MLYKMNIPESGLYDSFISYNYFIVKNNKIYEISILNSCYQNYVSGNYIINDTLSDSLTNCSVNFLPVIDFSLKHSDSLKFDKNHWTILNKKIINKNDTIYEFIRSFGSENYRTVIFATKKEGFIGVYDSIVNQTDVINPIGVTFTKFKSIERFKTKKMNIDLKIFKEFKKVE